VAHVGAFPPYLFLLLFSVEFRLDLGMRNGKEFI
jgi:hypothetical protein